MEQMKDVCDYFIEQSRPRSFAPGNNELIKHEKSFEGMCANMEESGVRSDGISVYQFYSRIEHFENKYSKIKHGSNKQV